MATKRPSWILRMFLVVLLLVQKGKRLGLGLRLGWDDPDIKKGRSFGEAMYTIENYTIQF